MKKLTISLLTIGLLSTSAFALTAQEVAQQIQQIEKLPLNQRIQKMNQLKKELRQLNKNERQQIMQELEKKYHITLRNENQMQNRMQNRMQNKHQKMQNMYDKEMNEMEPMEHPRGNEIERPNMEENKPSMETK